MFAFRRCVRLSVALCLGVCLVLLATSGARVPSTVEAQTALPSLPERWPTSVQLGMGDGPGGASVMRSTAPFGFRYQYLAGGANTSGGWKNWDPDGSFVTHYIQNSLDYGMTPVFSYYQIRQSEPNNSLGSDGDAAYANLQNASTMAAYYS